CRFFFQAEDGIRDDLVTGVQTCALPISLPARLGLVIIGGEGALIAGGLAAAVVGLALSGMAFPFPQAGMLLIGMVVGALVIGLEIGRASCRERGYVAVGVGGLS